MRNVQGVEDGRQLLPSAKWDATPSVQRFDALIARLNLRAFAVLAQAMTDEPADRPDTLDETA